MEAFCSPRNANLEITLAHRLFLSLSFCLFLFSPWLEKQPTRSPLYPPGTRRRWTWILPRIYTYIYIVGRHSVTPTRKPLRVSATTHPWLPATPRDIPAADDVSTWILARLACFRRSPHADDFHPAFNINNSHASTCTLASSFLFCLNIYARDPIVQLNFHQCFFTFRHFSQAFPHSLPLFSMLPLVLWLFRAFLPPNTF